MFVKGAMSRSELVHWVLPVYFIYESNCHRIRQEVERDA